MSQFDNSAFRQPIKSHPLCKECQCYPEGRNDCPDHMKCREWLERERAAIIEKDAYNI